MKHINAFLNHFRIATSSKLFVVSAFIVLSGISIATNLIVNPNETAAADCSGNSIMTCGVSSKKEFVSNYKKNVTKDLPAVYGHFGLSSSELSRFESTAKEGKVYKDGRIVVDGKVVAHGAEGLGRFDKTGSKKISINRKTYYQRPPSVSFAVNSIPAYVMFDKNGKVEFVALKICGNPFDYKQPSYSCNMLNSEKVDNDTYRFSANVTAKEGAKLKKVVYEFGDGSKVTKSKASEVVTHTYKPGDYTAKVTAYFEYYGQTYTHTSVQCTKKISVPKPIYKCSALKSNRISRTEYEFTVEAESKNGASLKSANFNFGDDQTADDIKTEDGKTVVTKHNYEKAGDYKIVATVNFNIADEVKSVDCETEITVDEKPFYACKMLTAKSTAIKNEYEFTVDTDSGNGASLKSANFNFGDDQTADDIKTEDGKIVVTKHNYEKAGTYTIVATANFDLADKVGSEECKVDVTIEEEETPETPETPEIPSTGPGAVLGGFVGSSALGLGVHNWARSRRNLRDAYKK